jgi:hypothetical protein
MPSRRGKATLWTLLLACLCAAPAAAQQSKASGDFVVPNNLAAHTAPAQPLPFSHKAHDTPAIQSLHTLAKSGHEIPWVRVYAVTPGVTWAHRPHVDAGVQCETCHGDISQADVVSETKATVAMATCISCHEAQGAKTECVTCHAWPTDKFLGIK